MALGNSRDSEVSLATWVLIPAPLFNVYVDNLFNLFACFRFLIYKVDGWIILVYHLLMVNLVYQWMDNAVYLLHRFVVKAK